MQTNPTPQINPHFAGVLDFMSGDQLERARAAADTKANRDKAAKFHAANDARAMRVQLTAQNRNYP